MAETQDQFSALAEQYIAGVLPAEMQEEFEDHFLTCRRCREEVQFLQTVRESLAAQPQEVLARPAVQPLRWRLFSWQAGLAVAMLALVAVALWRWMPWPESQPVVAVKPETTPAPAPAPQPAPQDTMLARLELPAYIPVLLRGSNKADTYFEQGMKAYQAGDCGAAAAQLKQVDSSSAHGNAAQFYRGACLLKLGNATDASAALTQPAHSSSPYQQAARFYLAMADHALGDDETAKKLFSQVASQKGDYAKRAQAALLELHSLK